MFEAFEYIRLNSPHVTRDLTNVKGTQNQMKIREICPKKHFLGCDWLFGSVRDIFRYIIGPLNMDISP